MKKITNPRAYHDYNIIETYEAGINLLGAEVKSVKGSRMSLEGSFVKIVGSEIYLVNAQIFPYPYARPEGYDSKKTRTLLLKKKEILRLAGLSQQKGLTLIPLRVYTNRNLVKLEFGLCRGKKQYEKRESIKKREVQRNIREML